jgi:hypothetical protein
MNPHKNFDLKKAIKEFKKIINGIPENKKINYMGEEIKATKVLAISPNIKEHLDNEYIKGDYAQGRDKLDVVLLKIFQLGYSVGYSDKEEDDNELVSSNKLYVEMIKGLTAELKKLQTK